MRLRLLYSIFLFTLAVTCFIESSEAKGRHRHKKVHKRRHYPAAAHVIPNIGTDNVPATSSTAAPTVFLSSSTPSISSTSIGKSIAGTDATANSSPPTMSTAATFTTTPSLAPVTNSTSGATTPITTTTTVTSSATPTTTLEVTESTTHSTTTSTTVTSPTTHTTYPTTESSTVSTTEHSAASALSYTSTSHNDEETAATEEKKSHIVIILVLAGASIVVVVVVAAVLLYRKKQKKKKEAASSNSKSTEAVTFKKTTATKSTVTPTVGPQLRPSQPPAPTGAKVPARVVSARQAQESSRNPARSDNENMSNPKMVLDGDDETQVELNTDREVLRQKDPFGPPRKDTKQQINMPAQQISKGHMQKKNNSGALNTKSAPQPTAMNRLFAQKPAELNFECLDDVEADDTQVMESVMDDYSDQEKKNNQNKEADGKIGKGKNENVEMVHYGGQWRIVDKVGSDFSFSIETMDDLV